MAKGEEIKTERVGVRLTPQMLQALDMEVAEEDFQDRSSFIVEAIKEKLDPGFGKARLKRQLRELLREDPEFREDLSKAAQLYQKL